MKIIRLWGVIAFFVLVLLVVAAWYLLAPSLIKSGIEATGTEVVGAKVEINEVKLSLFPLGVEIKQLQAADPDSPMSNLVEVGLIKFAVDSDALMWKKIQIDELNISDIQLGTSRNSSGAIPGGRATEQLSNEIATIDLPELSQQDVKSMVEEADLLTVKRLNTLDTTQQRLNQEWKKALDSDANKARVESLEDEFKRLTERAKDNKLNLIADRKDWKKLNKAIDKERDNIKTLNNKFKQDKELLATQVKAVRNGPEDDLDAIMNNMGLGNGIDGLSDRFLGPEVTPWLRKALDAMSGLQAEPSSSEEAMVYSTDKGLRVQFKDEQLFPDVLIKKVNLSGKDQNWSLSGDGSNLGYFPWLVGQPAKLDLAMSGQGSANLSLHSEWQNAQTMNTKIDSNVDQWPLKDFQLMETSDGAWMVNSGQLDSNLNGKLTLESIDLNLSLKLNQPKINSPANLSGWQETLAESLNQQSQLSIDVAVTGSLQEPQFKIRSSIENLFKDAIGKKLKQQAEKLKSKFSEEISAKVGDLGDLDQYTKNFDQWKEQLKSNDELLEKLKVKI
jgi:uncharacterized protein (TIGR03545 family)